MRKYRRWRNTVSMNTRKKESYNRVSWCFEPSHTTEKENKGNNNAKAKVVKKHGPRGTIKHTTMKRRSRGIKPQRIRGTEQRNRVQGELVS